MNDIMKIVQALEDSNILPKGVIKTSKNETRTKRKIFKCVIRYFRSQLGNLLAGKGIVRAGTGKLWDF